MGNSQRICEQLIENYKMNLSEIITDEAMQIHMAIRGGFRIEGSTSTKEIEIRLMEHFVGIIGIIQEWLISPLVKKWATIMRIITMEIGVILIIYGIAL